MFGEVAVRLIKAMGYTGAVPGAIAAEDVPEALVRLRATVERDRQENGAEDAGDEEERAVSLTQRAWPLIEMLESASADQSPVMWR